LRDRDGPAGETDTEPGHPAQVGQGGGDDVDARVQVVGPVHRDLVDAQPGPFGQYQQLGVEEPAGVLAAAQVPSVLPLSAMVTRVLNGKLSRR
jgi:hypothetical protein